MSWRPFSCPSCHAIIEKGLPRKRGEGIGCLLIFLLATAALIFLGMRWYWSGLAGAAVTISLNAIRISLARRLWPNSIRRHEFRTEVLGFLPLAEFLESVAVAESWTPQLDRQLYLVDSQRSPDDSLENAAVGSVINFKDSLQGVQTGKKIYGRPSLTLPDQRERMRCLARDLRWAAKT